MIKFFLIVFLSIISSTSHANFKNIPKFKNNIYPFELWLNKNNYRDYLSNEKLGST